MGVLQLEVESSARVGNVTKLERWTGKKMKVEGIVVVTGAGRGLLGVWRAIIFLVFDAVCVCL